MLYLKRLIFYVLTALFINSVLLYTLWESNGFLKILMLLFLLGVFIYYNIKPSIDNSSPRRQKMLTNGYELIIAAGVLSTLQIVLHICTALIPRFHTDMTLLIINGIIAAILTFIIFLNGFIRTFMASKQLGMGLRLSLLFLWWVPIINIVLIILTCKIVKTEYNFLSQKRLINDHRKDEKICQTKYPLLMIHGIFFRDWKYFNYWGRIPKELTDNGACIYYGNHNSSLPVEQSAAEIRQRIVDIVQETGCEKVNIIAHSKGGIDSRYAISCLDADKHVASLTTINTPHRGSSLSAKLVEKTPEKVVAAIGNNYEKIFTKLGDDQCDFCSSVNELSMEQCVELNKKMIDCKGVFYQSVGSKMGSSFSAFLPLSAGHAITHKLDGDNDGLVATSSMAWGKFLGVLTAPGKKGISHGDMIDLTRKDIPGFDVCEFYVNLVSNLKQRGL